MNEYQIQTTSGDNLKIAAANERQARELAKRDGHQPVRMMFDTADLINILLDTPFAQRFSPKNEYDFGPSNTVWLRLKRAGKNTDQLNPMEDYGVYLGQHGDKFVVGISDFESGRPCAYEEFNDLAELKQVWMLD
jgi:hypothetical protein